MKRRSMVAVVSVVVLLALALTAASSFAFSKLRNTTLVSNALYQSSKGSQPQAKGKGNQPVITINGPSTA